MFQHTIYKPPSNSTVHSLPTHPPINYTMQNTIKQFNLTKNNSNAFANHNSTKLPPKIMHSQVNSTHVLSNPMTSISNTSYSISSIIIHPQSSETPARSNQSTSTVLYPSLTILNTNHSLLSTKTPIHMHSPGNWTRSNNSLSHQVGQPSGSHSNGSNSSSIQNRTIHNMSPSLSHSSMSGSANPLVNFSKSNTDSIISISQSPPSTSVRVSVKKLLY